MKQLIIVMLAMGFGVAHAENITGDWYGMLDVGVMQLKLVFHVSQEGNGFSSTMDSPDQHAYGINANSTTYKDHILSLSILSSGINFSGELKDNSIVGTFQQGGTKFPLTLTREIGEKQSRPRPQEPKEPYPYYTEDVYFPNSAASIKLAGTLTLPSAKGKYPTVIMITGSGPQDRDEAVFGHRPFWIIADHLARKGIASLRFDDRGTAKSEGDFAAATTFDFVTDVTSAIEYLKTRKEVKTIGLLGHSEGGIIAPIVASQTDIMKFIILLAGTGDRGDRLLLMQQEAIMRAAGKDESELQKTLAINAAAFEIVIQSADTDSLRADLHKYITETIDNGSVEIPAGNTRDEFINSQLAGICNPWMLNFMKLDPTRYLEKVRCPVLALNGAKDLQVPSGVNLAAIRNALARGGNKAVTTKEYPGLNHLFQACETGLPDEYQTIEQTFAPAVLDDITSWIKKQK
ncbi:MAG: alpha/beta hydrolase [Candidatus Cloacimonetes bacterium HGW-Cloacimonetes-3]|nr:MAG: alpha/beta hydrolase [Candidatus Cloacimonetes bacterium HGW-Cloacimonetes-3]